TDEADLEVVENVLEQTALGLGAISLSLVPQEQQGVDRLPRVIEVPLGLAGFRIWSLPQGDQRRAGEHNQQRGEVGSRLVAAQRLPRRVWRRGRRPRRVQPRRLRRGIRLAV